MCPRLFLVLKEADTLLTGLLTFNNLIHLESTLFPDKVDGDCGSLDDPKCSLPHLKSIKLTNFHGKPLELHAIKLFLNYAGFLETVTIEASPWLSRHHKKQLNVTKLLLMLPKPANCVVKFLTSSEDA
ncbi:hypothetical protein MKW92_015680 [Papaver armeniacum]|nr:hypothetical protein MKW92_015680 [Papaver armeniacum]